MPSYCSDTFIEKLKGETPNDRNDRGNQSGSDLSVQSDINIYVLAIRVATKWFADHLKASSSGETIDVIMLSDDRGNREKAKATGIKSCGGN